MGGLVVADDRPDLALEIGVAVGVSCGDANGCVGHVLIWVYLDFSTCERFIRQNCLTRCSRPITVPSLFDFFMSGQSEPEIFTCNKLPLKMSTASAIVGNKVGSDETVDSYQRLRLIDRPNGQRYSVIAYVLCQQTDDASRPIGFVINLGNYATPKEASERATELIELTGYKGICAGPSTQWFDLCEANTINRTRYVATKSCSKEAILRQEHQRKYRETERRQKERERVEQEIIDEQSRLEDPETIEAYTYNWYALVKNKSLVEYHKQELAKATEAYDRRAAAVHQQYQDNPLHEDNFLVVLKEKLIRRGEEHVFDAIEKGHQELRSTVLGLTQE